MSGCSAISGWARARRRARTTRPRRSSPEASPLGWRAGLEAPSPAKQSLRANASGRLRGQMNQPARTRVPAPTVASARSVMERIAAHLSRVVQGKEGQVRLTVTSLIAGGHLLLEDVPGVGKTTLAEA